MFKLIKTCSQYKNLAVPLKITKQFRRKFLSQAYYCNEVWEHRLGDPVLQKVNLDELYHALDQRFQKTRQMSAVDVDMYVNAARDEEHVDELLDLVHKLRLSADTGNTLDSTQHAVIRYLTNINEDSRLLDVLDDRLNYGIFLDHYTANLLLDRYWKNKDFTAGARIASQLMLQEDVDHQLFASLALLHCYNYILNPGEWPQPPQPEEPEEEVKIRVKYIRNPYFDDHFDLRDPKKIVGKTIAMLTKQKRDDLLDRSFHILGLALYEKIEQANAVIDDLARKNGKVCAEIVHLIPETSEIAKECEKLPKESLDVQNLLVERVKTAERNLAEKDVAEQCKTFSVWEEERRQALETQRQRLLTQRRLVELQQAREVLKERETKLWFFENEENIELEIEEKQALIPKDEDRKKKGNEAEEDEDYVPPEIRPRAI